MPTNPSNVKRMFYLLIHNDDSISIEDIKGRCVTFFNDDTLVGSELIQNLEELGEL